MQHFSAAVGWIIRQGKVLATGRDRIEELRDDVQTLCPQMNSRNSIGWASCLFVLEQVISNNCL